MNLILAEQALLIALDDAKGRDTSQWGSDVGLAGALLLDLARLELLDVDAEGKIVAVDGAEPGHELVHAAYRVIRESSKPRNADGWVQRLPRELKPLRQRLARGLVEHASSPNSTPNGLVSCPPLVFQPSIRLRSEICANGSAKSCSPVAARPRKRRCS